jgi:hypothetical protein
MGLYYSILSSIVGPTEQIAAFLDLNLYTAKEKIVNLFYPLYAGHSVFICTVVDRLGMCSGNVPRPLQYNPAKFLFLFRPVFRAYL